MNQKTDDKAENRRQANASMWKDFDKELKKLLAEKKQGR